MLRTWPRPTPALACLVLLLSGLAGCFQSGPGETRIQDVWADQPWPLGNATVEGTVVAVRTFHRVQGDLPAVAIRLDGLYPTNSSFHQELQRLHVTFAQEPGNGTLGFLVPADAHYKVGDHFRGQIRFESTQLEGKAAIVARDVTNVYLADALDADVAIDDRDRADWFTPFYAGLNDTEVVSYRVETTFSQPIPLRDLNATLWQPRVANVTTGYARWMEFWGSIAQGPADVVHVVTPIAAWRVKAQIPSANLTNDRSAVWIDDADGDANLSDGDVIHVQLMREGNGLGAQAVQIHDAGSARHAMLYQIFDEQGVVEALEPGTRIRQVSFAEAPHLTRFNFTDIEGTLPLENVTVAFEYGSAAYVYHPHQGAFSFNGGYIQLTDHDVNNALDTGDSLEWRDVDLSTECRMTVFLDGRELLQRSWLPHYAADRRDAGNFTLHAAKGHSFRNTTEIEMDRAYRAYAEPGSVLVTVATAAGVGVVNHVTLKPGVVARWGTDNRTLVFNDLDGSGGLSDGDLLHIDGAAGTDYLVTLDAFAGFHKVTVRFGGWATPS